MANDTNQNQEDTPNGSTSETNDVLQLRPSQVAPQPGRQRRRNRTRANNNKRGGNKRGDNKNNDRNGQEEQLSETASSAQGNKEHDSESALDKDSSENPPPKPAADGKKKNNTNRKKNKKKFPWRSQLPKDSVDPITLDPLDKLSYPPFALVTNEPFTVVTTWPVVTTEKKQQQVKATEEERQARMLQEQWGTRLPNEAVDSEDQADTKPPAERTTSRHYNLFDGRALAYYLVSELQFMDPLNRRSLTRAEMVNLDNYLRRHRLKSVHVVRAFDSVQQQQDSASSRSLQEEARILLQSLFTGGVSTVSRASELTGTSLQAQYNEHEAATQRVRRPVQVQEFPPLGRDDGHGVIINAGLSSTAPPFVPGQHRRRVLFPPLRATASVDRATSRPTEPTIPQPAKKLPATKTLASIAQAVKKTDPEEQRRQYEAREAALRRAMRTNLTFGTNANPNLHHTVASDGLLLPPELRSEVFTDAQSERNRNLAQALDVRGSSSTVVKLGGWARPLDTADTPVTSYPEIMIQSAREKMNIILRVEKKWKAFLEDDKAASLPLNKMDRPTRTVVHHYSDYWGLHTESFDPEPHRYIHCVKLQHTRVPFPMLSDAARHWPSLAVGVQNRIAASGTLPPPGLQAEQSISLQAVGESSNQEPPSVSTPTEQVDANAGSQERQKLELAPRTLPVEQTLEEMERVIAEAKYMKRQARAQNKQLKQREREKLQKKALQAAFDDDEDDHRELASQSSSDWSDVEPLHSSED